MELDVRGPEMTIPIRGNTWPTRGVTFSESLMIIPAGLMVTHGFVSVWLDGEWPMSGPCMDHAMVAVMMVNTSNVHACHAWILEDELRLYFYLLCTPPLIALTERLPRP